MAADVLEARVDDLVARDRMITVKGSPEIEDDAAIRKILVHSGLLDNRNHDPPSPAPDRFQDFIIDESYSQLPQDDHWMM